MSEQQPAAAQLQQQLTAEQLEQLRLEPEVKRLAEEKLDIMRQIAALRNRHAKINQELSARGTPAAAWVVSCW